MVANAASSSETTANASALNELSLALRKSESRFDAFRTPPRESVFSSRAHGRLLGPRLTPQCLPEIRRAPRTSVSTRRVLRGERFGCHGARVAPRCARVTAYGHHGVCVASRARGAGLGTATLRARARGARARARSFSLSLFLSLCLRSTCLRSQVLRAPHRRQRSLCPASARRSSWANVLALVLLSARSSCSRLCSLKCGLRQLVPLYQRICNYCPYFILYYTPHFERLAHISTPLSVPSTSRFPRPTRVGPLGFARHYKQRNFQQQLQQQHGPPSAALPPPAREVRYLGVMPSFVGCYARAPSLT